MLKNIEDHVIVGAFLAVEAGVSAILWWWKGVHIAMVFLVTMFAILNLCSAVAFWKMGR